MSADDESQARENNPWYPDTAPPSHHVERFLVVNVPRDPTRRQIIDAVDAALQEKELPTFHSKAITTAPTPPVPTPEENAMASGAEPPPPENPKFDKALLMLVRQEGWPPSK